MIARLIGAGVVGFALAWWLQSRRIERWYDEYLGEGNGNGSPMSGWAEAHIVDLGA